MNLMTTTNYSDNKIKLVVFSSGSELAFRHTVKSLISWSQEFNYEIKF